MEKLENINTKNFVSVIEEEKDVIVLFYSEYDKSSMSILELLSDNDTNKKLLPIDINTNWNIAMNFAIKAFPAIILFENGKPTEHIIGKEDIEKYNNILKLQNSK